MAPAAPLSVLFACNLNRVRSPMAAALARRLGEGVLAANSCGLAAAEAVDPFMAAVMQEVGVDLSEHQPKTFDEVRAKTFDLIIALTPEAHARALDLARAHPVRVECWPTADPTLCTGSREQRLEAYREVRADLERRLAMRFGRPST